MFNTKKVCTNTACGFTTIYDSDSHLHNKDDWKFCPICGGTLKTEGYSPNIWGRIKWCGMKVKYNEKDIEAGMYLLRGEIDMAALFKIGWTNKKEYCLISMTDGWIDVYESKEKLVDWLNKDEEGYIPVDIITVVSMLKTHIKENI